MKFSIALAVNFLIFPAILYAQWLPNAPKSVSASWFEYEPACDKERRQLTVKLLDSTSFLFKTDIKEGTILYAIKYKSTLAHKPAGGIVFCEPYTPITGTIYSYRERSSNKRRSESGFSQCLTDFNDDGKFDEPTGDIKAGVFEASEISQSHQYRYEYIPNPGPPQIACPRQKNMMALLTVNEFVWAGLTDLERSLIREKGDIDIIPSKEAGIVMQSQKIDASTSGDNSGSILGEAVSASKYIDKSINNGTYSAEGQLKSQITGAVIGSLFNTNSNSLFKVRYTLKTASGEILTLDKSQPKNDFVVANELCVSIPKMDQIDQSICTMSVEDFRLANFEKPSKANDKANRLREIKKLFEEGLISEKLYLDYQVKILD